MYLITCLEIPGTKRRRGHKKNLRSPFPCQPRVRAVAAAPVQSVFGHCSKQKFASHYAVMAIGRVKATPHAPPDAAECLLPFGRHARLGLPGHWTHHAACANDF